MASYRLPLVSSHGGQRWYCSSPVDPGFGNNLEQRIIFLWVESSNEDGSVILFVAGMSARGEGHVW